MEEIEDGKMLNGEMIQLDIVTELAPCILLEVGSQFVTLKFDTPENARVAWEMMKHITDIETD